MLLLDAQLPRLPDSENSGIKPQASSCLRLFLARGRQEEIEMSSPPSSFPTRYRELSYERAVVASIHDERRLVGPEAGSGTKRKIDNHRHQANVGELRHS
ncbi:hypothetical protein MKZ38_008398 [Zalerion maritima]|uniref:Uncharacterized protein n=1 Tax=Zalerion maritima TaxID=339359 RepID=A0AAD5WP59_9PEZI|nr:hypothetical protein MKZ38_008398 [Zalerion maritima]